VLVKWSMTGGVQMWPIGGFVLCIRTHCCNSF